MYCSNFLTVKVPVAVLQLNLTLVHVHCRERQIRLNYIMDSYMSSGPETW